jgi:carboxylesterase
MNDSDIMEGAGPFNFEGNEIGLLLLHGGGGGTAADLLPLAKELHEEGGFTIRVPLLPGYGTSPEDLKTISVNDWIIFIGEEISILRTKCETLIVGGHSMGAILTLIMAAEHNFDALFTISAPVGLQGFMHKLVPLFKFLITYYPVDSEQFKRETKGKWVGYDKIPLNIVSKIKTLVNMMVERLPKIHIPILLFQGRLDSTIKEESMEIIYQKVNSTKKRKIWLKNSDHPILCIPDHDKIISELMAFINNLL